MEVHIGDRIAEVNLVKKDGDKVSIEIDGKIYDVDMLMSANGSASIIYNGNSIAAELSTGESRKHYDVNMFYRSYHIDFVDSQSKYLRNKKGGDDKQDNKIVAPMPGKVVKVPAKVGDVLNADDIAVVLEAMKMQSNYKVTKPCTVKDVLVQVGDSVNANQVMIELEINE